MAMLSTGLALFFGLHLFAAFRSRAPDKDIKLHLGQAKYMGLFSLISLLGLLLIIFGYRAMPNSAYLFAGFAGGRNLVPWVMLPAMILIVCSDLPRGHIKAAVKHPMLLAVGLWSIAHLMDGANLRQLMLFGSFLAFCVIDFVAVSMRDRKLDQPVADPTLKNDILVLVVGIAAYFVFAKWLHQWLFGFAPLA